MGVIVQRVLVPAAAVLAGIAAMLYGAMYHRAPVAQQEIEEREVEEEVAKTIRVPVPVAPGAGSAPWGGVGSGQKPEPGGETAPPGTAFVTQTVKVLETVRRPFQVTKIQEVPEPAMIFEITVGGIAWSPHGLRRTYAPGEPPPSLCPT